jgi:hypothetical protein
MDPAPENRSFPHVTRIRRTHALAAAVALLGGFVPACLAAQMPTTPLLRAGQSVAGQIEEDDAELQDGSFYDAYEFEGRAGERITITLRSGDFDTYLHLMSGETRIAHDDDGAGGTDSRIVVTLPATGKYLVVANSMEKGKTGGYTLQLESNRSGVATSAAGEGRAAQMAASSSLPVGKYKCQHIYYDFSEQRMRWDWRGTLHILPRGAYRWMNAAGSQGQYRHDAASGRIQWIGGLYGNGYATGLLKTVGKHQVIEMELNTEGRKLRQTCYWQG